MTEMLTYTKALKQAREISRKPEDVVTGQSAYRIAIGGNCNARFLDPGLRVSFNRESLDTVIHECDYDSWVGDCLKPSFETDAWVIWLSTLGVANGGVARGQLDFIAINSALNAAIARGERVVVILPETMDVALDGFSQFSTWNDLLRRSLVDELPEEVLCIDPDRLALAGATQAWFAPTYWSLAKLPLHPDVATLLAMKAGEVLLRSRRALVKAVIVDLDNTLWGGVIGEDGIEGIRLDPNGDGRPYLQLQRMLKDLSDQGVPLAVVSKNNPSDAHSPFERCDEMILEEDDFVDFRAGWGSKFESIQSIVAELGIGMNTVCFIDDSPHERDEARAFLPDLIVPEMPENPEMRPAALMASGLFLRPTTSKEDLARVDFYKDEAKRRQHSETYPDWESYLSSLEMQVEARPISASNLQRVASLVQKTNQFNLTNRRHDSARIMAMAEDPNWFTYCYALNDRFGSAGIVGVLLAHAEIDAVEIDSWLLSCRVINRQVELVMFDHLLKWMNDHGHTRLSASYLPTSQNVVIKDLLPDLGLRFRSSDDTGEHYAGEAPAPPDYCAALNITSTQLP